MSLRYASRTWGYETSDDSLDTSDTAEGISPELLRALEVDLNDIILSFADSRQRTRSPQAPVTAESHGAWERIRRVLNWCKERLNSCVEAVVSAARGVRDFVCSVGSWILDLFS